MKTKEFINELIKNKYKEFTPNKVLDSYASKAYQKRVRDDKGTKYFLTCYFYSEERIASPNVKDNFEFSMQFTKVFKGKNYTINLKVFSISNYINSEPKFYPLNEIEELVEELFQKQKFEYYEQ